MKSLFSLCILFSLFQWPLQSQELSFGLFNTSFEDGLTVESILDKSIENVRNSEFEYNKQYLKQIRDRHSSLKEKLQDELFYNEPILDDFIEQILSRIIKANPTLDNLEVKVLVSRNEIANASYMGSNIIILNSGLFDILETEDELAFVICHELAHLTEMHLETDIKQHLLKINSKEYKKTIRKIRRSKFNKNQKSDEFFYYQILDFTKHSRGHEIEADKKGMIYYSQAGYDLSLVKVLLQKLSKIDDIKTDDDIGLERIFNFKQYPFKKRWLKEDKVIFGGKKELSVNKLPDSLRTHPNCDERIRSLDILKYDALSGSPRPINVEIKSKLFYDHLLYNYEYGDLGRCVYIGLKRLKENEKDSIAIHFISSALSELYDARLRHNTRNVVKLPSSTNNPELKKVLYFLQNIRMSELAEVNYNFSEIYGRQFRKQNIKELLISFGQACLDAKKNDEFKSLKEQLDTKFPNNGHTFIK